MQAGWWENRFLGSLTTMNTLTVARFACDLLGTALVFIDTLRSRRNDSKVAALENYNESLALIGRDFRNLPPAPGMMLQGRPFDEITEIMVQASEEVDAEQRKKILQMKEELDSSEPVPLIYVALVLLFVGIILHGANEYLDTGKRQSW